MISADLISLLLPAPLMLWAGWVDLKKRVIPNIIPMIIILLGVLNILVFRQTDIIERIVGLALTAIPLLCIALKLGGIGGGDIKYTAALGVYFGIYRFAFIYAVATIFAMAFSFVTKQKSIPLAFALLWGYIVWIIWNGRVIF